LASDPHGFDPIPVPELPKLEAVELFSSTLGRTGSGEAVAELHLVDAVAEPIGLANARWWERAAKRAMDVVVSAILLLLLLPLLLVVAVAIGVSSRGPILFLQRRVGLNGEPFGMLKFRSMRRDAHDGRDELAHLNEATGPVFKIRNDPRVTRVGRLIRRWSIDELPQLANVLFGQMSLVGPRPPLEEEYVTYGSRERGRLGVKPGLTCTWQVSGRSEVDFETWVDMDLDYISSWSLGLDLRLLAQTIPAVLRGRGAY
jgi:lipopolysaccharide/colanic/teichoic acid biosynthesis glycosyltransferase